MPHSTLTPFVIGGGLGLSCLSHARCLVLSLLPPVPSPHQSSTPLDSGTLDSAPVAVVDLAAFVRLTLSLFFCVCVPSAHVCALVINYSPVNLFCLRTVVIFYYRIAHRFLHCQSHLLLFLRTISRSNPDRALSSATIRIIFIPVLSALKSPSSDRKFPKSRMNSCKFNILRRSTVSLCERLQEPRDCRHFGPL